MNPSERDEWKRTHDAFLRRRGRRTLFAVFAEDWPCDVCHDWIRAGDGVAMTGEGVEHATCPARWNPTVIDGGRTGPAPHHAHDSGAQSVEERSGAPGCPGGPDRLPQRRTRGPRVPQRTGVEDPPELWSDQHMP